MYSQLVKVINPSGLHARPAAEFVKAAKSFACKTYIRNVDTQRPAVNARSITRIMGEGMSMNTTVEISADGEDEKEAVNCLVKLVASGFGEVPEVK